MNAAALFPGKYIKASDLGNRDCVLTIDRLSVEMVGTDDDAEEKPVLAFRERTQKLVLNKTNTTALVEFLGPETNDWEGHAVVAFPTRTQFGSKMVDCVRLRKPRIGETPEAGADGAGSETPF